MSAVASVALLLTNTRLCSYHSHSVFHLSLHPRFRTSRFNGRGWATQRLPPLPPVVSASLPTHAEKLEDELAHSSPASSPTVKEAVAGIRKIPLSNTVVIREREVYFGRTWNALDVGTGLAVLSLHVLCLFAPFTFTWPAFWTAFSLYLVTGLFGINLSYHRGLSHGSFKLPKWLEYTFAYCGVQTVQGNPIDWVSTHRYHHQHCDTEADPHSPTDGFWFSHMNWLFDTNLVKIKSEGPSNVVDMEKQLFYRFIRETYLLHPIALGALLYAIGGFPFLVWGMGVRIVWVYHITWMINSVCHVWGNRVWNTKDLSKNNWFVSYLALGEGWHNNHHAFGFSAKQGFEWWQVDFPWYAIRLLEALGLATDVKVPTQAQMEKMKLNTGT